MTLTQEQIAALPGLVKPLEWHKSHINSWNGDWHTLPTGYTVRCADENGWKWQGNGGCGYSSSDATAKAEAQADYEARTLSALNLPLIAQLSEDASKAAELAGEVERLREALTPSGDTKAEYIGEFSFSVERADEDGEPFHETFQVPWTTIKEIMAAIRARADLDAKP